MQIINVEVTVPDEVSKAALEAYVSLKELGDSLSLYTRIQTALFIFQSLLLTLVLVLLLVRDRQLRSFIIGLPGAIKSLFRIRKDHRGSHA